MVGVDQLDFVVDLLVDVPVDQSFSYISSQELQTGQRVVVDFTGKKRLAIVVDSYRIDQRRLDMPSLKPVLKVLDLVENRWFSSLDIEFLRSVSDSVFVSWGEMCVSALPRVLRQKRPIPFSIDEALRLCHRLHNGSVESVYGDACHFHRFVLDQISKQNFRIYLWIVDSIYRARELREWIGDKINIPVFLFTHDSTMVALKEITEALNRGPVLVVGTRHLGFFPLLKDEVIFLEDAWMDIYRQEVTPKYDLNRVLSMRADVNGSQIYKNMARRRESVSVYAIQSKEHKLLPVFVEEDFRKRVAKGERCAIFMFGSGYARMLRCSSCKTVQSCTRCDRPYSLVFVDKRQSLYCPSCGQTIEWQGKCMQCSSISVRLSSMGAERWAKIIRDRLRGMNVFVNSSQVTAPGVYIFNRWQGLCSEFSCALLLGIDKILALDIFYSLNLALDFIASASWKTRDKLFIRTRFEWLADEGYAVKKDNEIRRDLGLPPYGKVVVVSVRDRRLNRAKEFAAELSNRLSELLENRDARILGPYVPVEKKKRDYFYFNIDIFLHKQISPHLTRDIKDLLLSVRKRNNTIVTVEAFE